MAAQYAFVMKDMTKSFPGAQKPVLSHINLQFYHAAKIGIVGPKRLMRSGMPRSLWISVSIRPGRTPLTRMPLPTTSAASY